MKKNIVITLLFSMSHAVLTATTDVVETAKENGCSLFYDAVMRSGLYEHAKKMVDEEGSMAPFTLFAPTNEACAALKNLSTEEQKKIITLHVIPSRKIANTEELAKGPFQTVGGKAIQVKDKTVSLEGSTHSATITNGPLEAKNGVVYIIDTIISPEKIMPTAPSPEPKTSAPPKIVTQKEVSLLPEHSDELVKSMRQLTQTIQLLIHILQQQAQMATAQQGITLGT